MRATAPLAVVTMTLTLAACAHAPPATAPADVALINELRRGGYVIFIRHAKTDWTQNDNEADPGVCATQRNLTIEGRAQARAIGTALESLRIPVGAVLTSPFCRAYDTGVLAFGYAQRVDDLTGVQLSPPETRARRVAALRALFSTPPPSGENLVIVSHMISLKALVEVLIGEGDAAIVRPGGGDAFELVATVRAARWSELAENPGFTPITARAAGTGR